MQLGDDVEKALTLVGITKSRVSKWLGHDCKCKERQEKLNRLGAWAARVTEGRLERAKEFLETLLK